MRSSTALAAHLLTTRLAYQASGFDQRPYQLSTSSYNSRPLYTPYARTSRLRGWTRHIHLNSVRRQQAITSAKIFGIGALVGFGIKLLVTALVATFALPIPGIAVMMAAAVAGGVVSSVVRTWVGSRIRKTKLERGWFWKSVKHGFIAGAAGGLFGAFLANFVPIEHLFHHQPSPLTIPPPVPAPAMSPQEFLSASHPASPYVTLPAGPGLELPKNLNDFVSSPAFHNLPPSVQKLGEQALSSHNVQTELHFYKEASFQMINGRGHTLASERMGKALVNLGAHYAHTMHFHDVNAAMLFRDQAFLNKFDAVFNAQHAPVHHASFHSSIATHSRGGYGDRISSPFGMRLDPFHHVHWEMHPGIDIPAPSGTPIYAASDGTVAKIVSQGWGGGYGKYVLVAQDGRISMIYAHMRGIAGSIHPGMHVSQGDVLGYVGTTGRSTGNHLYFGVTENGKPVNPLHVLDTGSRRLADLLLG